MSQLLETVILWVFALLYGAMVLVAILKQTLKLGYRQVFQWKPVDRPKSLDDPTLGTHGFLKLPDVCIHYVASGPEDKPLMLFVHGFPEFWYSWRNQIREFQKDYRVVAIDMRGYGESDKPKGLEAYGMATLMVDLKNVIQALDYKSCILAAHDWGGALAFAFARNFPDMVDKLIIMNAPPAPVFKKILRTDKKQFKMSWYMFLFQLPYLPELIFRMKNYEIFDVMMRGKEQVGLFAPSFQNPVSEEDVNAYKYTFSQPGALTPPINFYRSSLQRPSLRVDYDMAFVVPVLLIWGCKDTALSLAIPDMTEKENPNIKVVRIEESGHFVQTDAPELTNKAMREWLSSQQEK